VSGRKRPPVAFTNQTAPCNPADDGPWVSSLVKQGSLFLTAAGAPYDFRWRRLSPEPFEVVMVLLGLSLFDEALQDVFGANAAHATLRDVSGFEDPQLVALLQCLREEAERPMASRRFVQGVAALIARNTTERGHCRQ
jgi:AraC family transcriptional regulator